MYCMSLKLVGQNKCDPERTEFEPIFGRFEENCFNEIFRYLKKYIWREIVYCMLSF